jgi:tetratricopeptide (TPR) repeat protein
VGKKAKAQPFGSRQRRKTGGGSHLDGGAGPGQSLGQSLGRTSGRDPERARGLLDAALAHFNQGRLGQAERLARQALRADPEQAGADYLLGILELRRGDHQAALAHLRVAVAYAPDSAIYHNDLASLLVEQGGFEEALVHYHRVLALRPGFAEGHYNLGRLLYLQGQPVAAVAAFDAALALRPDYPEAEYGRGIVWVDLGDADAARAAFTRALELAPGLAAAHHNLGVLAARAGDLAGAIALYRAALGIAPEDARVHLCLGLALHQQGHGEAAMAAFAAAIRLAPDLAEAHCELGHAWAEAGAFTAAEAAYRAALAHGAVDAYRGLVEIRRLDPQDDAELRRLEDLLAAPGVTELDRISLSFALGALYDRRGDPERAFAHYAAGNQAMRLHAPYAPAAYSALAERIRAACTRALLERRMDQGSGGDEGPRPIFVVGRPRSGTTLIERILAAHPEVRSVGEIDYFTHLAATLPGYPEALASLGGQAPREIAAGYRAAVGAALPETAAPGGGAVRGVVDKTPTNYEHLGLIYLAFPNARIIHCRRAPLDSCLSGYFQLYATGHHYSYDLADLAHHYREYEAFMEHWRRTLPLRLLSVDYEGLVRDPEPVVRRILAYCDLPYAPRCLAFHEAPGAVHTASAWQVRQPLYDHAVGRWRRYEAHLAPLRAALGDLAGGAGDGGDAEALAASAREATAAPPGEAG